METTDVQVGALQKAAKARQATAERIGKLAPSVETDADAQAVLHLAEAHANLADEPPRSEPAERGRVSSPRGPSETCPARRRRTYVRALGKEGRAVLRGRPLRGRHPQTPTSSAGLPTGHAMSRSPIGDSRVPEPRQRFDLTCMPVGGL